MVRTLLFDTETTGLPKFKGVGALVVPNNWPDIVSICWLLYEGTTLIRKEYFIIRPDGWVITPESIKFHGITHEKAVQIGHPLQDVLLSFHNDVLSCDRVIAHNMFFDKNVVLAAYKWRLKMNPSFWDPKKEFCSMAKSKEELKIPSKYPKPGDLYKYPSLDQLYSDTFKADPPTGAHSADRDVDVLQQIVWKRWPHLASEASSS